MGHLSALISDPAAWAALVTLVAMEVILAVDNLLFISILTNKLPEEVRSRARRIGIGLALILRLGLLSTVAWLVTLNRDLLHVAVRFRPRSSARTGPVKRHPQPPGGGQSEAPGEEGEGDA